MTNQKPLVSNISVVFLIFFLVCTNMANSQCSAGSDNTLTVCSKDQDIANRAFSLFNNLGGAPTTGGVWSTSNPANFFALDANTGEVDLWRINTFGVHQFVYTNCSGDTATVTINLGGYPGEDNTDGSANACGDDTTVNLYSFLGSSTDGKVQDFNGVWEEVPAGATGSLTGNFFNALDAGPGVYTFTYTVAAVDICPARAATIEVEVHPPANPGVSADLTVCTTSDLSVLTNFNLSNRLVGEDTNGTWSEGITNQLSDLTDNIINVQEINDNFGYGVYTFRYTVLPSHPVCSQQSADVNIIILPALEGALTAPNFCIGTPYDIQLNYDDSILPNGTYEIDYSLNDSSGTRTELVEVVLNNGQGIFEIPPLLTPLNEFITVSITGIDGITPDRDVCPVIDVTSTTFLVSNASATAVDVCPNTDETITLDSILDVTGSPSNATYDVEYTLTDPNSNSFNFTAQNIDFTNGTGSFDIPFANLIEVGNYSISIDIPAALDVGCMIDTTFTVIPTPPDISLDIIVDNSCDATRIDVLVDAPLLADGTYTVTYDVTEQNSSNVLVSNTINFNGGTANYNIDITTLSEGNYVVSLRSNQDDTTACRTIFDFEQEENFAIGGIPETPVAEANQVFCTYNFGPGGPTLSDLEITAIGTISFFSTETDTTALPNSTALVNGEDYFITSTDPDNNCESSERIGIMVSLITPQTVTTTNATPLFCGSENATVANLNAIAPNGGAIVWYDAMTGGNPIDNSELLISGRSYFAVESINGDCESDTRLEIIPTIVAPTLPSLDNEVLAICGLDNPTVVSLEALVNSSDWSIRWFNTASGGEPLFSSDMLQDRAIYYAESYDEATGCIHPERVPVTVDLSNCDPEDYNFFIPDGFSPNNDGRNDLFFIPNIEIIFPEFTLEIFNRYGSSLFKGDIRRPAWDGGNGSNIAPNGVYFYVIDYNKEGFEPIQGRLYLNR
ncbi:MAG: gliding motility-associated C-terminal domain-containing protein [Saonia sp.]